MVILTTKGFVALGQRFAAFSEQRTPSWAWISCAGSDDPFSSLPASGYLRASPLIFPSVGVNTAHPVRGNQAHGDGVSPSGEPWCATDDDNDPSTSTKAPPSATRLELHIAHHRSYGVPVLLLQGYHADGTPWTPQTLRLYLETRSDLERARPITTAISQIDHPVLCTPWCCIDPCETASLMGQLLSFESPTTGTQVARLDYLSVWWSIVAPLVGAPNRASWFCSDHDSETFSDSDMRNVGS